MTKKDIALTVGGVIATMVLAYLLYRLQQRDAAAAAAAAASAPQTSGETDEQQLADQSLEYQQYAELAYQQAQTNVSLPGLSDPASVATSATTAATGNSGTTVDSSDIDNLMGQIISDFAPSITAPPSSLPSMVLPIISGGDDGSAAAVANIPTTAGQAQQQVDITGNVTTTPVSGSTDAPVASPISVDNTPTATHLTSVYATHANLSNVHTNVAAQQAIQAGP